jgi:hypothetical protein
MSTLISLVAIVACVTIISLGCGAWLLLRGLRQVRARCLRAVTGRHVVAAQSRLPGSSRAAAAVRRDLDRDLRGAAQAVAAGLAAGRPVEPLRTITIRLRRTAADIDVDLAVIAAEPDPVVQRQLLAEQAERVASVRRACAQVRRGVLLAGSATTGPLLDQVVEELGDEIIRLGLWAQAHRELHGN